MHFASALATIAAESGHTENVALDTLPYGIVAAVILAALGLIVASYRNVANRHAEPTSHTDDSH